MTGILFCSLRSLNPCTYMSLCRRRFYKRLMSHRDAKIFGWPDFFWHHVVYDMAFFLVHWFIHEAPLKVHCVTLKILWSVRYTAVCNHLLIVIVVYLYAFIHLCIYTYMMWAAMFLPKPGQDMQQHTLLRNCLLTYSGTCFFFLLFILSLTMSI